MRHEMNTLFDIGEPPAFRRDIGQWMTPAWAADLLVERLGVADEQLVLEPSCGTGAWLQAIPAEVDAVGVEIDQVLATAASARTGRRVICGDFATVPLDVEPSLIVGNPPYSTRTVTAFLERAHQLLPDDGRCAFLLSTHLLQTPSLVTKWAEEWCLDQTLVPRTLFPRALRPLLFVTFTKSRRRVMHGFALYRESMDVNAFPKRVKALLVEVQDRPCWRVVVEWALKRHGGRARLRDLYDTIEPRRVSRNPWWREKVRQTLQRHFTPVARGEWALEA